MDKKTSQSSVLWFTLPWYPRHQNNHAVTTPRVPHIIKVERKVGFSLNMVRTRASLLLLPMVVYIETIHLQEKKEKDENVHTPANVYLLRLYKIKMLGRNEGLSVMPH